MRRAKLETSGGAQPRGPEVWDVHRRVEGDGTKAMVLNGEWGRGGRGRILPLKGHSAMSGGILGCHNLRGLLYIVGRSQECC